MTFNHIAIRIDHIAKKHLFSGLNRNNPTHHDVLVNSVKMLFKVFYPASSDEGLSVLKEVSLYAVPGSQRQFKILSRITTLDEMTNVI